MRSDGESFVLKLWPNAESAGEIAAYRLLGQLGVPTIRVLGTTESALLLEDLATSPRWRLAVDDDLDRPGAVEGLADWYRRLHAAGATPEAGLADLPGEYDGLSVEALRRTGAFLDLGRESAWARATAELGRLLDANRRLPQTLIYHDFHVSNVAVARTGPPAAVMIDFHLLRSGTRAGDLRNVTSQLGPAARRIFRERYGPITRSETIIDAPLATIGALCGVDPSLPRLPRWARALRDEVLDGTLDHQLDSA
ncbi:phosphotransferase family protein [Microlunatus speluncae]|uniref:phosphotransferase family protein n=1 Tax=Microlunatus speluncae TaxID=2594267 RepID=UPI0013757309|nr:phosphotransferase [Microlunatus speluncae]